MWGDFRVSRFCAGPASVKLDHYRLLVHRTGNAVKDWRTRSRKALVRRIGILTSPEPWRFYGDEVTQRRGADDYVCCAGTVYDECACGGMTWAEDTKQRRENLPPIKSIRVERRQVVTSEWEPMDTPPIAKAGEAQGGTADPLNAERKA